MHTGFDILEYNTSLRRYWRARVLAGTVDFGIVAVVSLALTVFLIPQFETPLWLCLLTGLVWYVYSTVCEGLWGMTPGKKIWDMRCVAHIGNIGWKGAALRNLPKLFPPAIIADVLFGLGTEGDPRQRFTERIFDVLVVRERFHMSHVFHLEHRWGPRRIA